MCQPNCLHTQNCALNGTGYECDLNNDSTDSLCDECRAVKEQRRLATAGGRTPAPTTVQDRTTA